MLNSSPQTPLAFSINLVEMVKPFMARLYRTYAEEHNLMPWRPEDTIRTIMVREDADATILSISHQVADVRQTVLWKLAHNATLNPDGTLYMEIAFAAEKPSQQTWHPALLHLTPSLELLE